MSAPAPVEVSVVVATYDRPAHIVRLLEQLDDQTLAPSNYEVVVVDDGSAVDLRSVLTPSAYRYALRVERQDNAGSAAARQLGAEQASGDVLLFVDDDMEVSPDFVESHLAANRDDDRLVVLGRRRAGRTSPGMPLVERYRLQTGDRLSEKVRTGRLEVTGEFLYTGNLSMSRSLFTEVGGFDPDLLLIHDAELGIRLEKAGATFVLSEEAANQHAGDPMTTAAWFER